MKTSQLPLGILGRAFDACNRRTGSHNQVRLADLRRELALPHDEADAMIRLGRRSGWYFLEGAERRLSDDDRAAAIHEHGDVLIFIGRRS